MSDWRLDQDERAELTDLLAGLVRIPSPDPPGDEAAMARFLGDWLREREFDVRADEFAPNRINLLARLPGSGGKPALVFSAHMDTMPIGSHGGDGAWEHDPFGAEITDGRLYGRGAADMKSGLAAMAAAALKVKRAGSDLAGDLVLAFSAGESSNCIGAKRMVEAGDLNGAGALLVSEPSSLGLLTAETGALWLEVAAAGRPGHASAGAADNAILKVLDFLGAVRDNPFAEHSHPLLGPATLAINTIGGGTAVNLTADQARATLDIRTVPGMTTAAVLASLTEMAGDAVTIRILDEKPSVVTDPADGFVGLCADAVARVTGTRPEPAGVNYFSDSSVLAPGLDVPRVIIGPGEAGMSGQRDEWVELEAVHAAAAVYGEIAGAYLSDGSIRDS